MNRPNNSLIIICPKCKSALETEQNDICLSIFGNYYINCCSCGVEIRIEEQTIPKKWLEEMENKGGESEE